LEQAFSVTVFFLAGLVFVLLGLSVGSLLRPSLPSPQKQAIYECGERAMGSSFVQFDLRFYIAALFFLVFDVEVVLIYPLAVVFRSMPLEALVLGAPFLLLVTVGFVYEWYSGSLEWVRSGLNAPIGAANAPEPARVVDQLTGPQGLPRDEMWRLARQDPEFLAEQPAPAQSAARTQPDEAA
jgi:NADH-quinone oxidoreductase subunit A